MKHIVIITEGSITMGLGHVQRMLSLAQSLASDHHITFITQSVDVVVQRIQNAGFDLFAAKSSYETALSAIGLNRLHAVLIDRLTIDESLAIWVKNNTQAQLIIFGNISNANQHAQVVVNAIVGTQNFINQRRIDPVSDTLYLEGPRYVMLGEAFRQHRNAYHLHYKMNHILLLFGGSDQANLTCQAAKYLIEEKADFTITACVGPLYPFKQDLKELFASAKKYHKNLEVVINSPNVCDLMLSVDCVVTSPGNTLFEAMCLGLPAVSFYQTENQANIFRGFPMTYEQGNIASVYKLLNHVFYDYPAYRCVLDSLEVAAGYEEICDIVRT